MKHNILIFRIKPLFVPVFASLLLLAGCGVEESQKPTEELDLAISRKQEFSQEKDRRIAAIASLFDITGITPQQEYDLNQKLY